MRFRHVAIGLMLAVLALFGGRLRAEEAPSADPAAELAAHRVALQNATLLIEDLRAQLKEATERIATLERALRDAGLEPDVDTLADEQRRADREAARLADEERRRRLQEHRERREAVAAREAAEKALQPAWYYTWQIGYINSGERRTVFVKTNPDGTVVYVGDRSSVDRKQIVVRGTFENVSKAPYRYTFEVRVAENHNALGLPIAGPGHVVASTRYQTPVLAPGELHRWEVTMSVDDALQVTTAGVGNVRADAPTTAAEPEATPGPAEDVPAAG